MASNPDLSRLIAEIGALSSQSDDASRKRAVDLSKRLTLALENPTDTAVQLSFVVYHDSFTDP